MGERSDGYRAKAHQTYHSILTSKAFNVVLRRIAVKFVVLFKPLVLRQVLIFGYALSYMTLRVVRITTRSVVQLSFANPSF